MFTRTDPQTHVRAFSIGFLLKAGGTCASLNCRDVGAVQQVIELHESTNELKELY